MDPMILLVLVSLFTHSFSKETQPRSTSKIAVMGIVYCDICSNNTFSRHSYFLPGVQVHINCKFNAISPTTTEQISFSVNRTTDRFGIYRLEIPSVDGVKCAEGLAVKSDCQASLIGSSSSSCNIPGLKTTSDQIAIKSKQANLCFYSLNALNYRPPERDINLCGEHKEGSPDPLNSEKFFLPFYPPFGFPWPPFPTYPLPNFPPFPSFPFPPLPPFPSFPFPPIPPIFFPPLPPFPSFPFPPVSFPKPPPSLPFPFPPLPPTPPLFSPSPPPPPVFNLGDPRIWIPFLPPTPSLFSPPPPPVFNLGDPRTWIPFIPPSPPNQSQVQHP